MKARIRYWNGKWWCRRMGVTGCGQTMEEAYEDMWNLYREMIQPSRHNFVWRRAPRGG